MSKFKQAYDECKIGATAFVSAKSANSESMETFQVGFVHAQSMEAKGLITIVQTHKESQSQFGYVDLFQFKRLE